MITWQALWKAFKNIHAGRLESKHGRGYEIHPVSKVESNEWEEEQDWGDE